MEITLKGTSYYAHNATDIDAAALKGSGWLYLRGMNCWRTSKIERVTPFLEACVGKAQEVVGAFHAERSAAIEASVRATLDIDVPCPPGLSYRGYQLAGIEFMRTRFASLNADVPRLGKAQPLSARVLTPSGWVRMGDIRIGDYVISGNGNPTRVSGVFPQGIQPVYKVTFTDGTSTRCSRDHLWKVISKIATTRKQDYQVRSLAEIMEGTYRTRNGKSWLSIPVCAPVAFPKKAHSLSPYVVGYLLGNGSLTGSSPAFSFHVDDKAIVQHISEELPQEVVVSGVRYTSERGLQALITTSVHKSNYVLDELRRLGMNVRSSMKRIHSDYLYSSVDDRIALLRGLMDADGSCNGRSSVFHSNNRGLATDVADLVRSLGGEARFREYCRPDQKNYCVTINLTVCPFRLERKARRWIPRSPKKYILSISEDGREEQQCISVEDPSRLYVTDDYIVTHNTIQTMGVINSYDQPLKVLVMCPANAKINWTREARKWIVNQTSVGFCDGKDDNPETDFLVVNYDILPHYEAYLQQVDWDIVVCDEAHRLGNAQTARTQIALGTKKTPLGTKIWPSKHFLFLTATPALSRPIQMFPMFKILDPKDLGSDWFKYAQRYCAAHRTRFGLDTSGTSNEEELQFKMRSRFMIRREKWQVVDELPASRQIVYLPKKGLARLLKEERSAFQNNLTTILSAISEEGDNFDYEAHLASIDDVLKTTVSGGRSAEVKREIALRKVPLVEDFVDEILLSEQKVVVFYHHRDPLLKLAGSLEKKYGVVTMMGGLSTSQRQQAQDRFREDPNCRVFIGNYQSAGEAISLASANVVVCAEIARAVPSEFDQAEERVWLVDKEDPVAIYWLVVEDSVEADVAQLLQARKEAQDRRMTAKYLI